MSSILDALEKSERERNHDAVPQYHNMQPPEEKSRRWLWLLLAVALVLLLLAVFFAARYWLPLSQQNGVANPTSNSASANQQSGTGTPTVVENTPGVIYDYSNLPQTEQDTLPQLRINVVSVSADPKRSFVMLGEKLYREGDTVAQGVSLVTIQKDHVVMNHHGKLIRRGL